MIEIGEIPAFDPKFLFAAVIMQFMFVHF